MKPNTLSHYLSDLTGCGLVAVRRQGGRCSIRSMSMRRAGCWAIWQWTLAARARTF
ncbi:hypothetical protein FLP41_09780 [Paracoccus marcusii]|uniref:hypothetical protein n=1 Tax=Paracoccus marcusii TaxID=59779 RepID=UPI002ED0D6F9|nr:hypothetical protein FLP41_09780 [Paracoccus marcusii]